VVEQRLVVPRLVGGHRLKNHWKTLGVNPATFEFTDTTPALYVVS
jgi:hypothetical protein